MRLADVMTHDLPRLAPGDSVRNAARKMADHDVAALPICDSGRLKGIVTDWDVTVAVASGADLDELQVSAAMSGDVVCAAPDARLDEAAEILATVDRRYLCVIENGQFRGIVHLGIEWVAHSVDAQTPSASFGAAP
jgi:CBS domain-containing protein